MREWSARTRAIAAGRPEAGDGNPANVGIVPASALGLSYSREHGTPTWDALEAAVGELEGGTAISFASGIGAVSAVFDLLPAGAAVAVPSDSYVGTRSLLGRMAENGRVRIQSIHPTDTSAWVAAAASVDLLWLESPTNPSLDLIDIPAVVNAAAEREDRPLVAVDNTFATPLGQLPLALGADIVVHSATKLIGGHSDLLLGLAITDDDALSARLREIRTLGGATPGALEAWLALRGLRTLPLRYREALRSAELLAERLAAHPAVLFARHPGIGAMVSFDVADAAAADAVCKGVSLIHHATSLGGVETTMERRALRAGDAHVAEGRIRLSVGLEDPEDLWFDLVTALDGIPSE